VVQGLKCVLGSILVTFQSLVSLILWYRFWFHYLFYELFKDPISLRDKRIKIKSNITAFIFQYPHDFHELIVFILPFIFQCPHDFHELIVFIFPFIFQCPHDFHELIVFIFPFTFHCPHDFHELIIFTLIVLMIYFNPLSSYLVVLVI
jgi:hypothetical protein